MDICSVFIRLCLTAPVLWTQMPMQVLQNARQAPGLGEVSTPSLL